MTIVPLILAKINGLDEGQRTCEYVIFLKSLFSHPHVNLIGNLREVFKNYYFSEYGDTTHVSAL